MILNIFRRLRTIEIKVRRLEDDLDYERYKDDANIERDLQNGKLNAMTASHIRTGNLVHKAYAALAVLKSADEHQVAS